MAKKLYVGGVAYSTTKEGLENAFKRFGTVVSATVMIDRETNRSRGFGFVEMEDADAEGAINGMNGATLDGRKLTVNEARPMIPRKDFNRPAFSRDRGNF